MTVAVYPGTFDPVHFGHVDIVKRAAELFECLTVGIYDRPQKRLMFTAAERVEMVQQAVDDIAGVRVACYSGLTVDFVRAQGASVIVRGLRAIVDFELEYQMALTNRRLAPELDVVCLMTSVDYAFLSSTIVKDVALAGGRVDQFVPAHVQERLARRVSQLGSCSSSSE